MRYWAGITDFNWFRNLAEIRPDEVNFWQPGATRPCRIDPGTPFVFKLRGRDVIAGVGFFMQFTILPIFLAWDAFGRKNGTFTLKELRDAIGALRPNPVSVGDKIGCNILTQPCLFEEHDWIPVRSIWRPGIRRGRYFDTEEGDGRSLWDAIRERISARQNLADAVPAASRQPGRYYLAKARLGQGTFRTLILDTYERRCAVTGEKTLPTLEAAHIKAHASHGPSCIENGLLLRADLHRLFDKRYVTVDPDMKFVVSDKIHEHFDNGKEYRRLHGIALRVPRQPELRPSPEFITWHNQRFEQFDGTE